VTVGADRDRAATLDEVLERMATIEASLPADDGVAVFNRMYREVTRLVREAVVEHEFVSASFLSRLDVNFANLYFDAYRSDVEGLVVEPAWAPLFEARRRPDTQPIQFALAGMNAHICHDLPLAVLLTCRDFAVAPRRDSPEHADFTRTNEVLAQAQEEIKGWFCSGLVATVDRLGGRLDDGFAAFGIHVARAGAWDTSEMLWHLADTPRLDELFRAGLSRTVALTSRGILL
jgi:hypothetical protein